MCSHRPAPAARALHRNGMSAPMTGEEVHKLPGKSAYFVRVRLSISVDQEAVISAPSRRWEARSRLTRLQRLIASSQLFSFSLYGFYPCQESCRSRIKSACIQLSLTRGTRTPKPLLQLDNLPAEGESAGYERTMRRYAYLTMRSFARIIAGSTSASGSGSGDAPPQAPVSKAVESALLRAMQTNLCGGACEGDG